jgi:murein DD-endopeptidase MepM/ murein hydrolase activator NlpD
MAAADPSAKKALRNRLGPPLPALLCPLLFLLPCLVLAANDSYTLRKGETLYRISRKFDVPVNVLQEYNHIDNPNSLREGTRIAIPPRYTVKKGDTLYSISREFQVDLNTLTELNGIADSGSLRVGTILFLPDGAEVAAGKEQTGRASSNPASTGSTQGDLLWPHPGTRQDLRGRITGTLIFGTLGDKVVSVSSGRVVWAGPYRGFSRVILIEGKNGYTYVYAGNEETLVTVGDTVVPGAEIGRLGKDAHQGVPQLYFLVYRNGKPVDPSLAPRS